MVFEGNVFRYGNDVNTDFIIPARYLTSSDPKWLASHCMEDIDKNFIREVKPGDIIVAQKNFGCGSSREHAPIAIKAVGISCVIAESFARIFYRNSINIGLPIIECPEMVKEVEKGDKVRVDLSKGLVENISKSKKYKFRPLPEFAQDIFKVGGLMNYVMNKQKGK